MRIFALLLAAAMAAVPATGRPADEAAALLAKHRAFTGWQFGDGSISSVVMSGDIVEPQRDGSMKILDTVSAMQLGIAHRTSAHNVKRGTNTASGFTGRVFWSSDENGFTRPELGEAQRYLVARDLLFNEDTPLMHGDIRGTRAIDATQTTIVRVTSDASDAIDLYVDPQTGAYKRAVIDPGGTYETQIDILGYGDAAAGKKIISKWKQADGKIHEWTKIAANVPVDAADLHPPAQSAHWTFGNGSPVPITVTQSRIYMDARVNGVPGRFILDTGAAGIFLTQAFADRAHVKPVDLEKAGGVGGAINASVVRVNSIQIGDNTLSNVIADAQDITHLDADGLLGFDLLAGVIANVDLSHSELTLYDPGKTSVDKHDGIVATVDLATGQPRLPMQIDKRIDVNAVLDTGDPHYLMYGHDLVYKYGLTSLGHHAIMAGVGGYELVNCGVVDSLSVGPVVYQTPDACESESFIGRNVLVGLEFLKNFDLLFDYPEATIVMLPRKMQ